MSRAAREPAGAPAARRGGSGEMFDAIAPRYDLVNRLLSLGLDQGWRRRTVRALALRPGDTALDLATGTADLAIALARALEAARGAPASDGGARPARAGRVIGTDPSQGMLAIGRRKVRAAGLEGFVELRAGDAQHIELCDASVDAVSMAFGIRNVPDRPRALREMARVTRPGGRVAILELSEPRAGLLSPLARLHIRALVPRIGGAISGAEAYRYLQASIARFPPPDAFAALMRDAGLNVLSVQPLTLGVVCLFVATPKPRRGQIPAPEGA